VATLLNSAIFFTAALLYLPQFMSKVLFHAEARAPTCCRVGTFMVTLVAGRRTILRAEDHGSMGAVFLAAGMFPCPRSATTTYHELIFGMVVLGVGVGLFYSSVTTAAVTALDPSRASLAGAIVYMFQIAGGSIGVGFNTAIVVSSSSMPKGIHTAFLVDGALAICSAVVAILFVGGAVDVERVRALRHHHRAHA
jgi:MFS family permease